MPKRFRVGRLHVGWFDPWAKRRCFYVDWWDGRGVGRSLVRFRI